MTKAATKLPSPGPATLHPQCAQCLPAKCCGYFSLEVDTPEDKRDHDDLLWMLAHQNVSVYIDEGTWYLMIHTPCNFLDTSNNSRKIYDTRSEICREHSLASRHRACGRAASGIALLGRDRADEKGEAVRNTVSRGGFSSVFRTTCLGSDRVAQCAARSAGKAAISTTPFSSSS